MTQATDQSLESFEGESTMAEEIENGSESPQESQKREKRKSPWTLEKCQKAARRFASPEEWAQGAPSSYKAAVARGWEHDCTQHMKLRRRVTA
jgi:hypothetical protein